VFVRLTVVFVVEKQFMLKVVSVFGLCYPRLIIFSTVACPTVPYLFHYFTYGAFFKKIKKDVLLSVFKNLLEMYFTLRTDVIL
jgi:hypothetical protein